MRIFKYENNVWNEFGTNATQIHKIPENRSKICKPKIHERAKE